jgi:hypothetical protein
VLMIINVGRNEVGRFETYSQQPNGRCSARILTRRIMYYCVHGHVMCTPLGDSWARVMYDRTDEHKTT